MLNKLSHSNNNTNKNNNNNNDNELRFLPVPFTEAAPLVWFGLVRFWYGFGFVCLILFSLPMQQHVLNYFHHLGANKYKFATTPPVDNNNSNNNRSSSSNNNDSKRLSLAKTAQAATATAPVEGCSCARLANCHFN